MKSRKIKKGESSENIMKLVAGENVNEVFENINKYEDYFLHRFAKAIGEGSETCELVQVRKGEETSVMFIEQDDFESVMLDRFQKAQEREDYERAAKWRILLNKIQE